jgi:hypothetical protein
VINERRIGKDFDARFRGLILMYYPGIRLNELRKTTKISVGIAGLQVKI